LEWRVHSWLFTLVHCRLFYDFKWFYFSSWVNIFLTLAAKLIEWHNFCHLKPALRPISLIFIKCPRWHWPWFNFQSFRLYLFVIFCRNEANQVALWVWHLGQMVIFIHVKLSLKLPINWLYFFMALSLNHSTGWVTPERKIIVFSYSALPLNAAFNYRQKSRVHLQDCFNSLRNLV
jgi:hypothetical protein